MAKAHAEISIYDGSYHDITADVISAVRITRGFVDQRPTTRVASPGKATFTLRNDPGALNGSGTYTHDSANWQTWFVNGAHVVIMLQVTPGGGEITTTKFEGWIKDIDSDYKARTVEVTCYDWLFYAAMKKMPALAGRVSDTALGAITEIKGALLPDGGTVWGNGTNAPDTAAFSPLDLVFMDETIVNYPALKELSKLIMSEFGFMYIGRKHTTLEPDANAIIVESRTYRDATDRTLIQSEKPPELCDGLLFEDGDGFLLEDGSTLVFNDYEESILTGEYQELAISDGKRVYNIVNKSYPIVIETTGSEALWVLSDALIDELAPLSPGYTATFNIDYVFIPPYAGLDMDLSFCEPANLITPVYGLDFEANQNADGSGLDLTTNFAVTITASSLNSATITVKNYGAMTGCITLLKLRGNPVIYYRKAGGVTTSSDVTSQDSFGESELSYTSDYQTMDYYSPDSVPAQLIAEYADSRQIVESVKFIANTSNHTLILAATLDVGSQLKIDDAGSGINELYYIDRVDYNIRTNGIVEVEWMLRDNFTIEEA